MRIAFLSNEFVTEPSFTGGLANYLHRAAVLLRQAGHEPEVFVSSDRDERVDHDGVAVQRVAMRANRILWGNRLTRWRLPWLVSNWEQAARLSDALAARHAQAPFDIAQAPNHMGVGYRAIRQGLVPVVVRISSYNPQLRAGHGLKPTWDVRINGWLDRECCARADAVYAPSAETASLVRRDTGRPVAVIRPPFDVDAFPANGETTPGREPYLLFFGAVSRLKGADLIAEALCAVGDTHPDIRFCIAGKDIGATGGGSMVEAMRARLGARADRIEYLGPLPKSELTPLIRGARGVVLPSRAENLSNALLESMALGRVVAGPGGCSFPELIRDGETGLLFAPEDAESLGACLVRLWTMPENERARVGALARETIRAEMNPRATVDALIRFYEDTIAGKPATEASDA